MGERKVLNKCVSLHCCTVGACPTAQAEFEHTHICPSRGGGGGGGGTPLCSELTHPSRHAAVLLLACAVHSSGHVWEADPRQELTQIFLQNCTISAPGGAATQCSPETSLYVRRYFPPDFDPADLPKGQRGKDNAMKVRMMLPMTVRCQTCGEFMYKGTKFNCKKEDVVGDTYLGLQIFRFYMRCRKCSAEITYLTDPQNLDYKMEHGATRNFEQWKQTQTIEEALKQRRDAEDEDKVKKLENKTADAKREMDMMGMLDDMLHTKGQHAAVSTEEAIAALKVRADAEAGAAGVPSGELTPADEAALEAMVSAGTFTRRIEDDEEDAAADGGGLDNVGAKRIAPTAPRRGAKVKVQRAVPRLAAGATDDAGPSTQVAAAAAVERSTDANRAAADAADGAAQAPNEQATGGPTSGLKPAAVSTAPVVPQGLGLGGYGGSSSSDGSGGAAGS